QVESVNYAGLESSPYYELHQKYNPRGAGGLLSFVIKGGLEAGTSFATSLKLLPTVANIGDAKSLVIHPASTTHSQLNEEQLRAAGIEPGTVRLSIGIENVNDIIADLTQGFEAVAHLA
ncbi:MAG: O-acetylhomoserine aminocarboxypropyltransferase/cysteine synthase, partial [Trueperella pyogenes]|nr:O-acetylhomoserine aminocarboxypropyltransferase/cysteine synthase [Trueperella pyogenes]